MTILRTPADVAGEAAPLPVYTPLLRALIRSTSSADVWGATAEVLFDRARRGLWVITAQPTEVLFGRLTALAQDLGALRGEGIATVVIAPEHAGDPALASRLAATIDRLSTTLVAAQPGRGGTPGVLVAVDATTWRRASWVRSRSKSPRRYGLATPACAATSTSVCRNTCAAGSTQTRDALSFRPWRRSCSSCGPAESPRRPTCESCAVRRRGLPPPKGERLVRPSAASETVTGRLRPSQVSARTGWIATLGIGVASLLLSALLHSAGSETLRLVAAITFVWGVSALCYGAWDALGLLRGFRRSDSAVSTRQRGARR
jgi:hypothetical protein